MSEMSFMLEGKVLSERERWLQVQWHFTVSNNILLLQTCMKTFPFPVHLFSIYESLSLEESFKYTCDTEILCAKSWLSVSQWELDSAGSLLEFGSCFPNTSASVLQNLSSCLRWGYKSHMSCSDTILLLQTSNFSLVESRWEQIVPSCCLLVMRML